MAASSSRATSSAARGLLYALFAAGLMFPLTVAILPLYLLLRNLGLHRHSLAGVIIPQIAFALPTTIIILVPFLRAIPDELEEAAAHRRRSRARLLLAHRAAAVAARASSPSASSPSSRSWNGYLLPLLILDSDAAELSPCRSACRRSRPQYSQDTARGARLHLARDAPRARLLHASPSAASSAASPARSRDDHERSTIRRPDDSMPRDARGATPRARRDRVEALVARDDARGEARAAVRRLGRGIRRRRRRRPAPARPERRRRPRRAAAAGPRPAHPPVRHGAGRPRGRARSRCCARSSGSSRASRFGIPALAHEECLAGFAAWGATAYPVPLVVGRRPSTRSSSSGWRGASATTCARSACTRASRRCSTSCATPAGAASRRPSARTRTSSATIGTAYVRGLESAGVVATLKHFVGYSASRAGRNLAPVSIGPRELADVLLPPFEMARARGRRALGHERVHRHRRRARRPADRELLTGLLRDTWGFDGHRRRRLLRGRVPQAAARRRRRPGARPPPPRSRPGIDVELPTVKAFGAPLRRRGRATAALDEARRRPRAAPRAAAEGRARPARRRLVAGAAGAARRRPRRSGGAARHASTSTPPANRGARRASSPSEADRAAAQRRHPAARRAGAHRRDRPERRRPVRRARLLLVPRRTSACSIRTSPLGIELPDPARRRCAPSSPTPRSRYARGTSVDGGETDGIAEAAALAAIAPTSSMLALGDRAGLFGRGTSGEGCDVESLALPGRAAGSCSTPCSRPARPTVVTLLAGRPYALGARRDGAGGDRADVLPRRGGRRGDRGRAQRPGQPERPAAGERARRRRARSRRRYLARAARPRAPTCRTSTRPPPSRSATGSATRRSSGRRSPATTTRSASTARSRVSPARAQHRRPSRHRGRAALPARPGRVGRAAGAAADRLRARRRSSRASGAGCAFARAGRPGVVHRHAPARASSSRASSCSASGRSSADIAVHARGAAHGRDARSSTTRRALHPVSRSRSSPRHPGPCAAV